SDDRGMGKVEFRIGGKLAGEKAPDAGLDAGDARRTLSFSQRFPLEPGQNEITVTAVDDMGEERRESLVVTRRLRFYETAYFLPSVVSASLGLLGLGFAGQRYRRRQAVKRR